MIEFLVWRSTQSIFFVKIGDPIPFGQPGKPSPRKCQVPGHSGFVCMVHTVLTVSQACAHTELWSQPKEIDLCPLLVISKVKQCDFSDILPALCLGSTTRSELSLVLSCQASGGTAQVGALGCPVHRASL